jgi:predicted nucleotidyltransferase
MFVGKIYIHSYTYNRTMRPEFKQKALEEFARSIRDKYGKKIKEIILYGSMAREEDNDHSDIDILVLSDRKYQFLQRELSFLAFDIGLKYGVEISVQNYVSSHYKKFSNYTFFQNVKKDGVIVG